MPVACGNTVLTGDSGSVAFTPAGTFVCLLDFTDFTVANPGTIQLPVGHGFLVGDSVTFSTEGGAVLATGLTADTAYFIASIDSDLKATVSSTVGGVGVELLYQGVDGLHHQTVLRYQRLQSVQSVHQALGTQGYKH